MTLEVGRVAARLGISLDPSDLDELGDLERGLLSEIRGLRELIRLDEPPNLELEGPQGSSAE